MGSGLIFQIGVRRNPYFFSERNLAGYLACWLAGFGAAILMSFRCSLICAELSWQTEQLAAMVFYLLLRN
jgi:hypothetical protein